VAEDQRFEPLDVAKVSPFLIENHTRIETAPGDVLLGKHYLASAMRKQNLVKWQSIGLKNRCQGGGGNYICFTIL
jgi:hypothetical protein